MAPGHRGEEVTDVYAGIARIEVEMLVVSAG
jgi:hypothetical protein